ncbi:MAG: hypothetical protein FJ098_04215 [Deltaproteobacteria bacterium]|nr:hypothetical protein [Deltaproteobacteria bacterium]
MVAALTSLALLALLPAEPPTPGPEGVVSQVRPRGLEAPAWSLRAAWDDVAEEEFAAWVRALGEARERRPRRIHQLLADPGANPLYTPEDARIRWTTDCGTLPYALRGYFAWKTGRPFSFQGFTWKRYTPGNHPRQIRDWSQYRTPGAAIRAAMAAANSGHFRMRPELEGTDTYPVEVSPFCVRPGVAYYEPNGHVLVVYRVDRSTGEIRLMDSHPDGTLTLKTFGPRLVRGTARFGGGFRGWRPYTVEVLDAAAGTFRITRELNDRLACHDGREPYEVRYLVEGREVPYHAWVQARMRGDGSMVDPLEEFPRRLEAFCEDVQRRAEVVDEATAAGVGDRPHPGSIPDNVYRSRGDWDTFGTAALDARLRFAAMDLARLVLDTLTWAAQGRPRLDYAGGPRRLLADYRALWDIYASDPSCRFSYTGSTGRRVPLELGTVFRRIWDLSFDPWHCPERRWGAGSGDPEHAACRDDGTKDRWYRREARLRHRHLVKATGRLDLRDGPAQPPGPADLGGLLQGVFPGVDLQALLHRLRG